MANFEVLVHEVEVLEHPDADALEIVKVLGYQAVVRKDTFHSGDLAVYIPEQAVVPMNILQRLNLWDYEKQKGKLAGSKGDRVKAVRLRGVLSQGLLLPLVNHSNGTWDLMYQGEEGFQPLKVQKGTNVTQALKITKWEPKIPAHMAGEVCNLAGKTLKYDIENVKNYPEVFDGLVNLNIDVHVTEKLHGTWMCIGIYPEDISDEITDKRIFVTSKGLSSKGLVFKDNEKNKDNLYMKVFKELYHREGYAETLRNLPNGDLPIFILGEVIGKGVQDLDYGQSNPTFRIFDIYEGYPSTGHYLPHPLIIQLLNSYKLYIPLVPTLYRGKITHEKLQELTDGYTSLDGTNVKEGVVVRTLKNEYRNDKIGRVILKSISDAYLTRKNATEYN
jgi:RNA ligase (TIGR02306 family)